MVIIVGAFLSGIFQGLDNFTVINRSYGIGLGGGGGGGGGKAALV